MRGICLLIIASLTIQTGIAQEAKVPTSVYYERKADLFRYLPNDPDEIILLGNSITDGGNWDELLGDPRIKNRGISADVTRGILNRADEILESKPLKIFLLIGINDLAKGASQKNILENIAHFVQRTQAESPRTQIYIQSVLPVNPAYDKYSKHVSKSSEIILLNESLVQLCKKMEINYLNLYSKFVDEEGYLIQEFTNDGLHLSGQGYLVWSEILKHHLNE